MKTNFHQKIIDLTHGAGGKEMHQLIERIRDNLKFAGDWKNLADDSASLKQGTKSHLVFTTDSYTVDPIFFPGGDIGCLAICGTINDLAVMGAKPLGLSLGLIIEEGLAVKDLEKIIDSIDKVSQKLKIPVVTGDTKVMERGKIDKIVINMSGVGRTNCLISDNNLRPGDKIIISGSIGEHAVALLSERFNYQSRVVSDVKPILEEVEAVKKYLTAAKDPTRGGLAAALNELAQKSKVKIIIEEEKIPIKKEVRAISELLGIDVLGLACEGRFVGGVEPKFSQAALKTLKKYNRQAAIIGQVEKGQGVYLQTTWGQRVLEMPVGKLVPRIC
jgi:hydrogenase expression/formation protein HypE